jgi:uncharacterized ParB-like nuclease family protein
MRRLRLDDIRLDFQKSVHLIEDTVLEYVQCLERGEKLPPIQVRFDGTNYFCEDGFHRVEASRRFGRKTIVANVTPGTLADMEANFNNYLAALKKSLSEEAKK